MIPDETEQIEGMLSGCAVGKITQLTDSGVCPKCARLKALIEDALLLIDSRSDGYGIYARNHDMDYRGPYSGVIGYLRNHWCERATKAIQESEVEDAN